MSAKLAPTRTTPAQVTATLNYYPSDGSGSTSYTPHNAAYYARKFLPTSVTVHNMRGYENDFSLDRQGFALVQHSTACTDFKNAEIIDQVYLPELAQMIKEMYVFQHA